MILDYIASTLQRQVESGKLFLPSMQSVRIRSYESIRYDLLVTRACSACAWPKNLGVDSEVDGPEQHARYLKLRVPSCKPLTRTLNGYKLRGETTYTTGWSGSSGRRVTIAMSRFADLGDVAATDLAPARLYADLRHFFHCACLLCAGNIGAERPAHDRARTTGRKVGRRVG